MILDTCFLIDDQRQKSEVLAFYKLNRTERLCLTVVTLGELASGFEPSDLPALWARLSHFEILDITRAAAGQYGALYRRLKASGTMIGANDLWIASVALANGMPVVTRNQAEFGRVPGLKVVGY